MRIHLYVVFSVLILVSPRATSAGSELTWASNRIGGEVAVEVSRQKHIPGFRISFCANGKTLLMMLVDKEGKKINEYLYRLANNQWIRSANFKSDDPRKIFALLSDGNVIMFTLTDSHKWKEELRSTTPTFESASKIVGDAPYVLVEGTVYASGDTGKTWQLDSAGIGADKVADITVDTNHHVWAISRLGKVFYQHRDSIGWRQKTAFKDSRGFAIFVDRKGRMFASGEEPWVRMSLDGGATWTNVSDGLVEPILSFGDDALGNVYAVGMNTKAYRLSNLTPPWVVISDSIASQSYVHTAYRTVNSIAGDSILRAATKFGVFESRDFGANWIHAPESMQLPAHYFYSPVIKAGGYFLLSNNIGVYRVAAGDTAFEKVYPERGIVPGIKALAADAAGNVYGIFPFRTGPTTTVYFNQKSTDQGKTWTLDTAGQGELGFTAQTLELFVDAQGTQYLAGENKAYVKRPGAAWAFDTMGLGIAADVVVRQISGNNSKGTVYLGLKRTGTSNKYEIYRRPVEGSSWQKVNSDAFTASDGILQSDEAGDLIVKVNLPPVIWKYDGAIWTKVASPMGFASSRDPGTMAVDMSGVIWVVMKEIGIPIPRGIYFSSNNGAEWTFAGMDGQMVKFLSVDRDMLYAVTFDEGIYKLTTTPTVSVREAHQPMAASARLYQNHPNPFKPATRIRFDLPAAGGVKLTVHTLHGRKVATLVNGKLAAGSHSAAWNATGLKNGAYICRLHFSPEGARPSGGPVASRKLLLLK